MSRVLHALLCAWCALALVCGTPLRLASAEQALGSITLTMGDGSGDVTSDMVGGTVVLYLVAGVDHTSGAQYDVSAGQFATSDAVTDIGHLSKAELDEQNERLSEQLEREAAERDIEPLAHAAIEGGTVSFPSVEEGLYLLFQTELSQGGRKMRTFLLSVPDDEGQLDIVAQPKPGIYAVPGEDPPQEAPDETPGTPVGEAPGNTHTGSTPGSSRGGSSHEQAPVITHRVPQTGDATPAGACAAACGGLGALVLASACRRRQGAARDKGRSRR